jgi:hypothetical protein|tara:strand:+ start:105 stop:275 length:171 start_codon:yes stop_codon:yes gene_type:complete
MSDPIKNLVDVSSVGITIGAFMSWIPEVTALASLVWVIIRIYETDTVQNIFKRDKS